MRINSISFKNFRQFKNEECVFKPVGDGVND